MTEKQYSKGDWTNCRYDICEILKNDELFCTVATDDADLIISILNENEQLKQEYNKLKHRHSLLHDECIEVECDRDRYHKDVLSLEKENEELKQEINDMKIRFKRKYDHEFNDIVDELE